MAWTAGADGTTGNVRVELFGVVVRRGVGPEPVGPVRWTWGPAVLGTFALAGAGAAIAARTAVGRLLKEHRPSGR